MPTAPLDTLNTVLNFARQRLDDMIATPPGAPSGQVGGEVLGNDKPFTLVIVNAAWRKLQDRLLVGEYSPLIETVTLSNVTAVATADQGINCYIDFANYFDGTTLQAGPLLPQNLLTPLRLRERAHGTGEFTPMQYVINGMTGITKTARNFQWTWDNNAIQFPGSTQAMDFELRYAQFLADFVANSTTAFTTQTVPLLRVADAFAWYIAFEACSARGDLDAAGIEARADAATDKLVAREQRNDLLRSELVVPDIPQPTGATVYDLVSTALNQARVMLNKINKAMADYIDPNSAWCQQYTNRAYRRLQEYIANKGSVRFTNELFIEGLTPCLATDPATQVSLSWAGYFNGVTLNAAIMLPQDFIMPFWAGERVSGQKQLYSEMYQAIDGLPNIWTRTLVNSQWEWRNDAIYMPGATGTTDMRIRYHKYLSDFANNGTTPWYQSQILIPRAASALAAYICVEVAQAAPDAELDPLAFEALGESAANMIFNRDVRRGQQTTITRQSASGRLEVGNQSVGYFW